MKVVFTPAQYPCRHATRDLGFIPSESDADFSLNPRSSPPLPLFLLYPRTLAPSALCPPHSGRPATPSRPVVILLQAGSGIHLGLVLGDQIGMGDCGWSYVGGWKVGPIPDVHSCLLTYLPRPWSSSKWAFRPGATSIDLAAEMP